MARVNEGADLIENRMSGAPGIRIGNIFVMAGVPHITAGMLDALTGTLEGGRPVVSFAVSQENKGQNLRVLASGGGWTCSCLYRPGDADLYPSVRLVEPPVCSAGK